MAQVTRQAPEIHFPGQAYGPEENMQMSQQVIRPDVEGYAYISISWNGWKFATDEDEQRFNEECDNERELMPEYPDNFDDDSRLRLETKINNKIDDWISAGLITRCDTLEE